MLIRWFLSFIDKKISNPPIKIAIKPDKTTTIVAILKGLNSSNTPKAKLIIPFIINEFFSLLSLGILMAI